MLKLVGILIAALVLAILIITATKPDHFHVERSATIRATPEKIYPLIQDFRRWPAWSPYEKLDPGMKRSLSGAESGKGAIYAWAGNSKAGAGRMEIVSAEPLTHVGIQLDFTEPLKAHNMADFTLQPQSGHTRVTWSVNGPNTFLGKIISLFFDMEALMGKDFEAGLATLKAVAEKN